MKITKAKLKQIIKEEIMREYEYDAQDEIYAITQHLSDAAMKLGEFANSLRGSDERKSLQFDSLSRQVKKIQGAVETHVSGVESGLQEGSAPPELVKQWVVEFEDFIASQYAGGKGKPIWDLPQDEFPAVVAALEQLVTKLGDVSSKQEFRQ